MGVPTRERGNQDTRDSQSCPSFPRSRVGTHSVPLLRPVRLFSWGMGGNRRTGRGSVPMGVPTRERGNQDTRAPGAVHFVTLRELTSSLRAAKTDSVFKTESVSALNVTKQT